MRRPPWTLSAEATRLRATLLLAAGVLAFLPPSPADSQEPDSLRPVPPRADTLPARPERPDGLRPGPDTLGVQAVPADTLKPQPADTLKPQPADTLPPVRRRPTSEILLGPEITVEVSRLGLGGVPLARLPYGAQILPGEEIREEASLTVADALVRLPGVTVADQFGSPYQPDVRVRGFTVSPVVGLPQSLSVFVDGVRVNEPDASQVQFDLIPMDDVERLEVIRGPGGAFGRNTLGGALNVRTARGSGPFEGDLELGAGSFGRVDGRGKVSGARGSFDYYVSGRYHESDGWRQVSDAQLRQGFAKVGYRRGGTDAWISYTRVDNEIHQPGSLPRSWLEGGPLPEEFQGIDDPREINFTGGDVYKPDLNFLNASLNQELGRSLSLRLDAYGRFLDVEQFNANISEPDFRGSTDISSKGATAELRFQPNEGGLTVSGGAEYVRHDVDIGIFEEPNRFFPDVKEDLTEHVGTDEENAGLFGQVWWPLTGRLSLTTSLRFDHVRIPFLDFLEPEEGGTSTFDEVSGLLGVDYLFTERASVFASYGRGFRAPVILEISCSDPQDPCPLPFELGADPPVDAVTADSWQAGARYLGDQVSLEGLLYWTEVHDDIFNVVLPPSTRGFFQNVDRTRRQGLELTLSALPADNLALTAGLALTRATFRSEALLASALLGDEEEESLSPAAVRRGDGARTLRPEPLGGGEDGGDEGEEGGPTEVQPGDEFSMVPNVSANLGADYEVGAWSFSLDGVFVGSQWLVGDESNVRPQDKLDPYLVLDAYAERSFGPLTAFALVENVLDLEYETFGIVATNALGPGDPNAVDPFLTPGQPRRIYAGVRYEW